MLLYDNAAKARILLQIYGSVWERVVVVAVISTLYSVGLLFILRTSPEVLPGLSHPFAPQSFGLLIAFAVCFRTNIAWTRFWEAADQTTMMFSKWSDAYAQLQGFANSSIKANREANPSNTQLISKLDHGRCEAVHFFSLLSAVAVERLVRGDIRRMEMRRRKGVAWKDQIVFREDLCMKDLTGSRRLIPFRIHQLKRARFDVFARPSSGQASEGIGEEEDEDGEIELSTVPRQRRPLNSVALNPQMSRSQTRDSWQVPVSVVGRLDYEELMQLRDAKDRPGLVLMWLGELVADMQPLLNVPPPILSRVFQELSNGSLGFSQAMKLCDIPFPFMFAQVLAVAMLCFAVVSPIAFTVISGDSWFTPLLSTGVVLSFWSLNEMAMELENPFGDGANNLPLLDAHERFAEYCIEMHSTCLPKRRAFTSASRRELSIYITGDEESSDTYDGSARDSYASHASYASSVRMSVSGRQSCVYVSENRDAGFHTDEMHSSPSTAGDSCGISRFGLAPISDEPKDSTSDEPSRYGLAPISDEPKDSTSDEPSRCGLAPISDEPKDSASDEPRKSSQMLD